MRVISQDGMIDAPYEQITINIDYRNREQIVAEGAHCSGGNTIFVLARYSTEAKARKAMGKLHNVWNDFGINGYFQFPAEDELEV